jgi:hypothetical protein
VAAAGWLGWLKLSAGLNDEKCGYQPVLKASIFSQC